MAKSYLKLEMLELDCI